MLYGINLWPKTSRLNFVFKKKKEDKRKSLDDLDWVDTDAYTCGSSPSSLSYFHHSMWMQGGSEQEDD